MFDILKIPKIIYDNIPYYNKLFFTNLFELFKYFNLINNSVYYTQNGKYILDLVAGNIRIYISEKYTNGKYIDDLDMNDLDITRNENGDIKTITLDTKIQFNMDKNLAIFVSKTIYNDDKLTIINGVIDSGYTGTLKIVFCPTTEKMINAVSHQSQQEVDFPRKLKNLIFLPYGYIGDLKIISIVELNDFIKNDNIIKKNKNNDAGNDFIGSIVDNLGNGFKINDFIDLNSLKEQFIKRAGYNENDLNDLKFFIKNRSSNAKYGYIIDDEIISLSNNLDLENDNCEENKPIWIKSRLIDSRRDLLEYQFIFPTSMSFAKTVKDYRPNNTGTFQIICGKYCTATTYPIYNSTKIPTYIHIKKTFLPIFGDRFKGRNKYGFGSTDIKTIQTK